MTHLLALTLTQESLRLLEQAMTDLRWPQGAWPLEHRDVIVLVGSEQQMLVAHDRAQRQHRPAVITSGFHTPPRPASGMGVIGVAVRSGPLHTLAAQLRLACAGSTVAAHIPIGYGQGVPHGQIDGLLLQTSDWTVTPAVDQLPERRAA